MVKSIKDHKHLLSILLDMYDHDYDTMKSVLSLANMAIEISPHGVSSCAECETEIQVKPRLKIPSAKKQDSSFQTFLNKENDY